MRKLLFLVLIISFVKVTLSQSFDFKIVKTTTTNFPYLSSAVIVYDNQKEPISNLTEKNFNILFDNNLADSLQITTFQKSSHALDVMICVDLSATMKGKPIEKTKEALLRFIDNLRGIDKAAIMGVADDAILIADFSSDKDYLKSKIKELNTKGTYTSLFYGLHKGLEKLNAFGTENDGKIVLVISDGKNENISQSYTEDDVIEIANNNSIPVFSVGFTKINKMFLQSLEKISNKTNGNYYDSPTENELDNSFTKFYNQLLNMYIVSSVNYNTEGDGKKHTNTVKVNVEKESKAKSNEITTPAGVASIIQPIKDQKTDWTLYGIIGGVLVAAGVLAFVLVSRNRRKQEELEEAEMLIAEKERSERERAIEEQKQIQQQKPVQPVDTFNNMPINIDNQVRNDESTMIIRNVNNLYITVHSGAYAGMQFNIDKNGATIGRAPDNSIPLPNDSKLSKHHCQIVFSGSAFYIEDLNSTNGTYVNGVRVLNKMVENGDAFKFGSNQGTITLQ